MPMKTIDGSTYLYPTCIDLGDGPEVFIFVIGDVERTQNDHSNFNMTKTRNVLAAVGWDPNNPSEGSPIDINADGWQRINTLENGEDVDVTISGQQDSTESMPFPPQHFNPQSRTVIGTLPIYLVNAMTKQVVNRSIEPFTTLALNDFQGRVDFIDKADVVFPGPVTRRQLSRVHTKNEADISFNQFFLGAVGGAELITEQTPVGERPDVPFRMTRFRELGGFQGCWEFSAINPWLMEPWASEVPTLGVVTGLGRKWKDFSIAINNALFSGCGTGTISGTTIVGDPPTWGGYIAGPLFFSEDIWYSVPAVGISDISQGFTTSFVGNELMIRADLSIPLLLSNPTFVTKAVEWRGNSLVELGTFPVAAFHAFVRVNERWVIVSGASQLYLVDRLLETVVPLEDASETAFPIGVSTPSRMQVSAGRILWNGPSGTPEEEMGLLRVAVDVEAALSLSREVPKRPEDQRRLIFDSLLAGFTSAVFPKDLDRKK